jgi:4-amino-4-deoxy-L-arabinose transferase-like glycosyltransferase
VRTALRDRSPRAVFWSAWVVLTALAGVWALANPMGASPDEPAHIVRAAALVNRAELVEERPGRWQTELPRIYALTHEMPGCYAFRSTEPASCWPRDFGDVGATELTSTTAGNYNPLYYAVVGAPTLLEPQLGVLYLMRLVSAALCAFCLALGLRTVAETARRRWVVPAAGVAMTPMVVFMNSTVNPNAVEASAGIGLWLTLLLTLRAPDPALTGRRWWRAGLLVVLLVNAKAFSPLYLGIIVLAAALLAGWGPVRAALTDRRAWPGLALGVAGSLAAVLWILRAGAVSGAGITAFPDLTAERALNNVLRLTSSYVEQMFGRFGWHDTPAPGTVYLLLAGALGLLTALALAAGRRRESVALLALAVVVVALPVVLQVPNASQVGLPWQGRYLMAVAVGVPLVAGVLLDARLRVAGQVARRVSWIVLAVVGVVHVMSFWENLRRYVAGTSAPWFEPVERPWTPLLPEPVLLGAAVLTVLAAVLLLGWLAGGTTPVVDADRAERESDRVEPDRAGAGAPAV